MEKKIDIAKILKDCPCGMELDCTIYDNVTLDCVSIENDYPIKIVTKNGFSTRLTKYGQNIGIEEAKCVIFPKGKKTWEGFIPPCQFNDGDILATDLGSVFFLNTHLNTDEYYGCYVGIGGVGSFHICEPFAYKECCGLATEEEKQKLFDAIKANGYKWNTETKTLEKLIKPKFKVGDVIQNKDTYKVKITEVNIEDECYEYESVIAKGIGCVIFSEQDKWEIVSNKFDITTLEPFDKVLVRNTNNGRWRGQFYMSYDKNEEYPFECTYNCWMQCIPFKGNEYLHNKTDDCDIYYKNWK